MSELANEEDRLVAYYDLKFAPITFDFCHFVVSAVAHANSLNRPDLDLVIIADGFRNITLREKKYSLVERQWRLWNLLTEVVKIVPQIRTFTIDREGPTTFAPIRFPPFFHSLVNTGIPYDLNIVRKYVNKGLDVQVFRPSPYALEAARNLLPETDRSIITLTVRRASFDQTRDSTLESWYEFNKVLLARGFEVVVIPDQDDVLGNRAVHEFDWNVIDVAAMSLDLRLAIYGQAHMNYVANGGLTCLFAYSKTRFMIFNLLVEESRVASEGYFKTHGLEKGKQLEWFGPGQEFVWESDDLSNLVNSIERIGI